MQEMSATETVYSNLVVRYRLEIEKNGPKGSLAQDIYTAISVLERLCPVDIERFKDRYRSKPE